MTKRSANWWTNLNAVQPSGGEGVCRCGESMVEEITIVPPPQKRYLTCKVFKDDGFHSRKPWDLAMCDEIARMATLIVDHCEVVKACGEGEEAEAVAAMKGIVREVAARVESMFPTRRSSGCGSKRLKGASPDV